MNDSTPKVGTPDVTMETLAEAAGFSDNSVVLALGDARSPTLSALEARVRHLRFFSWTTLNPGVAGGAAHGPLHIADRRWEVRFPEPIEPASLDGAVVEGLREQVHPLSLLEQLATALKPGGVLLLSFATDDAPPRMARWREFVLAIAGRLGFLVEDVTPPVGGPVALLRMVQKPRWRIGCAEAKDYGDIATLFHEVFGHTLSPQFWHWKYGDGRGNAVIARRDGALVAHYGGMIRQILLQGQPDWALQIGDVMVHPQERGVLTRQGPFFLTAATSAELYGPLGYGFPTERAMRVAEKMGLYARAGSLAQVAWKPSSPRVRWRTRVRHLALDAPASDRKKVDLLWAQMADDLRDSAVGVRDWHYIAHRYLGHPHHAYDVLLVGRRLGGAGVGVLVLRRHADACELLDVIGPLAHMATLVDQARRLTAQWGRPRLYGWISRNYVQCWLDTGAVEEALDIQIPTSCWTADARADVLRERWWLTAGDTDFR